VTFIVRLVAVLVSLLLMVPSPGRAADGPSFTLDGLVLHRRQITLAALQAMPAVTVEASYSGGHSGDPAKYKGVLLWDLLQQVELADVENKNGKLRRALLITGRDGYSAALAEGEIDPDYAGKTVILAYEKDGMKLEGGDVLLVVPGDKRGGRYVHDVVHIEVK